MRKPKSYEKICEECRKPFKAKRRHARFCQDQCRYDNYEKNHPRVSNDTSVSHQ